MIFTDIYFIYLGQQKKMLRKFERRIAFKVVAATTGILIFQDILKKAVVYHDLLSTLSVEKDALIGKVTSDGIKRFKHNMGRIK